MEEAIAIYVQTFCVGALVVSLLIGGLRLALVWINNVVGGGGGEAYCANPACTTGACADSSGNIVCDAYGE